MMSSHAAMLAGLRAEVLAAHRALLEAERVAYERLFGRIGGSSELRSWRFMIPGSDGCTPSPH